MIARHGHARSCRRRSIGDVTGLAPGCAAGWRVSGRRPGPDRRADLPLVPERIDDPAQTPAMLIANGGLLRGAGVDRPPHHGVGIIGHQQRPARRAAYRARAESSAVRPGRCHPERRPADGELRDDVIALPGLVKDACPERVRVESDGLASTLNPQLRLDTRHPPTVAAQADSGEQVLPHAEPSAHAAGRLADVGVRWCIAAGWALDLFRGEMTREHEDLEIAVPAARFGLIRAALAGFDIEVVGSGRRWPLDSPAFDVMIQTWVRERDTGVYRPGIFREPHDGDTWICRRDRSIRLPYEQVIATSPEGSRTWCRRSCCCSRPSTTGPGTGPASPACCRC